MTFEERVCCNMLKLNDVEDDIVDYIRGHAGEIEKLTIKRIAQEMYIAPNTVVRFAKKLGYKGFSELKYSLPGEHFDPEGEEVSRIRDFLEPALSKHILKTMALVDKRLIRDVLNTIYSAKTVSLFGIGDSQYFSELLAKYLSRVKKNIEMRFNFISDAEYSIKQLHPGDVALFISCSGESSWTIDLAQIAKTRKACTISITMDTDNTLRRMADKALTFSSEDKYFYNFNVPDLTGLMLLIRYISNIYWNSYLDRDP